MNREISLQEIKKRASEYQETAVAVRRHLHRHPERSKMEFKTAAYIAEKLHNMGIEYTSGVGGTGIVACIHGELSGNKVVALRADMDALPITETADHDYQSMNKGVMHACGHDAHMSVLLGVAQILNQIKGRLSGTVKFIFQPSEEEYPGGASMMIQAGVLENPRPDKIFALHVFPAMEAGKVGFKAGKYMASTDELYFTVKGKGGHGALPHMNVDPVLIASHIVVGLQQMVSRRANPAIPTVVSIGRMMAEGQVNIIPDEVKMEGIIRTFDETWRKQAHQQMRDLSAGIAQSMGGSCELKIAHGYPFLINDEQTTHHARNWAEAYLGKSAVEELELRMTAEDFAYYTQEIPGCFFRLGVRNESRGIDSNLHSSTFDIDESSLETGIGLMAWLAINELMIEKK